MIIDGAIRDIGEIRDLQFPVYVRGLMPRPGAKNKYSLLISLFSVVV